MDTLFPLRPFDFFSNRNTYTGSSGQLRYLIKPVQETLEVQVWNQDVCFELAQILDCASFPLSPGGLARDTCLAGWAISPLWDIMIFSPSLLGRTLSGYFISC